MVIDVTKSLSKIFHERARLGIMSTLVVHEKGVTFSQLVKDLELTRGNLSVHLKVLEESGFIKSKKEFVDKKPRTTLLVTAKGRKAFEQYLNELESIIKQLK